jgi:hypothetical protein
MNLDHFIGQHVAVQLMQSMLMMGPSREDPPRPTPMMMAGDQPLLGVHIEGTLMAAATQRGDYNEKINEATQQLLVDAYDRGRKDAGDGLGMSPQFVTLLHDQMRQLLIDAYNRGRTDSGDGYVIRYVANEHYMEVQLHPGAVYAVTRCTGEKAVLLHRPDSTLIMP